MMSVIRRSIPAWAGETTYRSAAPRYSEVYPRVGGGNVLERVRKSGSVGLSPRGRGKRRVRLRGRVGTRSIPAWAGETAACWAACCAMPVYPRVGGGNVIGFCPSNRVKGLSPRGRGKRTCRYRPTQTERSIPAWAGETGSERYPERGKAVYPRVGGGNPSRLIHFGYLSGLSPRGRGKPCCYRVSISDMGSIPAWAGETTA